MLYRLCCKHKDYSLQNIPKTKYTSEVLATKNYDYFDYSVASSNDGTKLAVGAVGDSSNMDAVYLFTIDWSGVKAVITQRLKIDKYDFLAIS